MNKELILEVSEYESPDRWFWRLKDAAGGYLDNHQVDLVDDNTKDCGYRGYHDLTKYLKDLAEIEGGGDRRKGEQILLARVGRWMGERILGGLRPKLRELLVQAGGMLPVRVVVPSEAQELISRPLELAWLGGQGPIAEAGVRLVWQRSDAPDGLSPKDTGGPLRVLGVFSLPTDTDPLNLRKERVAFKHLLHTIAATRGLAIETRVLQYGTTRDALREVLREAPGWDVIHFSCHGAQGALFLEDEKGERDPVIAEELSDLLKLSRPRLKLLTLSACWSGSGLTHQHARVLLGLSAEPDGETQGDGEDVADHIDTALALPSVAQQLAKALDCATLAMRYPVGDEFANSLTEGLFRELFEHRQPLAQALQLAIDDALGDGGRRAAPALSSVTPILVGARAIGLRIVPPPATPDFELKKIGLQGFDPPPLHFVGRVGPMLRASKTLAPQSGQSGVLFHGMAGGGKTACALELAHFHEDGRFQGFVWFKCPDEGEDIQSALVNCLEAVANQLDMGPAALIGDVDDPERFRERTVPRLRELFTQQAVLVVIDNMESLLTPQNDWLDGKWADFVGSLLNLEGLSRVVLTSRRVPVDLAGRADLLRENVTALSLRESLLLARELPNLRALYEDKVNGLPLLRDALEVIQGHPKLLEFADRLASDPNRFANMVKDARTTAERDGAPLQAFLRAGESEQGVSAFAKALSNWTGTLTDTLAPTARLMFWLLCRLEEEDRRFDLIHPVWRHFLERLGGDHAEAKAALVEPDGALEPVLEAVVACGLVGRDLRTMQHAGVAEEKKETKVVDHELVIFTLHPSVAEAGRAVAPPGVLDAADWELGDFHMAYFAKGIETEMEGGGGLIVAAARHAVPYLMRAARWKEASTLLERMIHRDGSPTAILWALPLLRRILEETKGTDQENLDAGVLAKALQGAQHYEKAETIVRDAITRCEGNGDWRTASALAGDLVDLLRFGAHLPEALRWTEKKIEFTRQAGSGSWTQLADEGLRLQVLNAMGRYPEVLDTVKAKRKEMERLSEEGKSDEIVEPWNVREALFDTGRSAAIGLEKWNTALRFNAEIVESRRRRGADELEAGKAQFNDYGPLLRLKRFTDARDLLEHCREIFEDKRYYLGLGRVYSALADLENGEQHHSAAVHFEQAALKYTYLTRQPVHCAISHHNLSVYLERIGEPREIWLPHCLASAIIRMQSGMGRMQRALSILSRSTLPGTPPTFDVVADAVERFDGVRFCDLFASLPKTYTDGDAILVTLWEEVKNEKARMKKKEGEMQGVVASLPPTVRQAFDLDGEEFSTAIKAALEALPEDEREEVLRRLREVGLISSGPSDTEEMLGNFEPLLGDVAAIAGGLVDDEVRQKVETDLERLEQNGWHLCETARRIWSGERDPAALTTDLDEQDTALILRVLELIEESPTT